MKIGIMWIGCVLLIGFAIYITKSIDPLWALLIPGLVHYYNNDK